jgi:crotonobetainyl-CoA:carnitine CoA-transferase CaiB-like acyl-CoA transferase
LIQTTIRLPAPEFGQHTEEILLELGCSWDEISRLQDQGVIA